MLRQLDDDALAQEERIAAARQLVAFQPLDKQVVVELLNRLSPQMSPELAVGIVTAMRSSESPEAGHVLVGRFRGLTPQTRVAGISVLLSRPRSTEAFLDAVDQGTVKLAELSLDQFKQR